MNTTPGKCINVRDTATLAAIWRHQHRAGHATASAALRDIVSRFDAWTSMSALGGSESPAATSGQTPERRKGGEA